MRKLILVIFSMFVAAVVYGQQDTLTTPSGLKYVRIKPGNGKKPKDGSKVKVVYTGTLPNGKIFDSNEDDAPFKITLGAKEVIPGWEEGIKLMSEGEKGVLVIPPGLAYGSKGVKDPNDPNKFLIPQQSWLIFQMELVQVK